MPDQPESDPYDDDVYEESDEPYLHQDGDRGVLVIVHPPQVVLIVFHDESFVADGGVALARAEIAFEPLRNPATGNFFGFMCWHEEGVPENRARHAAEALSDAGFAALAYEPFHDHEIGHSHAYQRVYTPSEPGAVFSSQVHLVEESDLWDVWLFGGSPQLETTVAVARSLGLPIQRIDGPDGLMCVEAKVRDSGGVAVVQEWLNRFKWANVPPGGRPLPAGSDYDDTI